ncbi:hypothetical protein [Ideonella dechloratans]|uniref:hypothetical protein n=1 Tax=Ideonella dechloratans TaxID=36863 RepID=UPI0035ADC384
MRGLGIWTRTGGWAAWGVGWGLALAASASGAAPPKGDPGQGWALCQQDAEPERCLTRLEAEALRTARASRKTLRAVRQGQQLSLQAPGGATITLQDSAATQYRGLGPLGLGDSWLVARLPAPQSPPLLLISPASGQQLGLEAAPRSAPDGHLLIAVRPGEDGHEGSTLTLLQRAGTRWSVVFRYEAPAGLHLRFQRWRSDGAAVHLQWERSPIPACPLAEGNAQLRDGPFGWDFVPPMPPPCEAAEAHSSSGLS